MPDKNITVQDIATLVGDCPIEVMEVQTQQPARGWTLFQWAHYFSHPAERKQLYNVISFEISDTLFGRSIRRPSIVSQLDWVNRVRFNSRFYF